MSLSVVIDTPKHYCNLMRHIIANASHCQPHRLTKKQKGQKKTAAAKAKAKARCDAEQEYYSVALQGAIERIESEAIKLCEQFDSHSIGYYRAEILQTGCLKHEMRSVSHWNAYLHHEAKLANENCEEEKIALTNPLIAELKEHQANVTYGQHNTDLGSFSNATQSLLKIEQYMCALHARTSMEMYLVACQSSADGFLHLFATFTSEHIYEFAYHQHKMSFQDLSLAFEAYCLAGVEGMINKQTLTTAKLKTKLKNLINLSLKALLGKVRMVYVGFKEKFTIPYGVVLEKWPLKRFIPSSELTCPEVDILLNAWTSSTTYFHKLDIDEWEKWCENYMTS
ncbi:hypothetical protein C0992_002343, partial [Termitomyces sp. T32_za158]